MAAKGSAEVKLTLKDGGSIPATKKKLDALNKTTDRTISNSKRLKEGSNRTKRGLEGVGQRANNTSKDFARMSQGMGGLVQAYATVAANVFALSTAFRLLTSAVNFQDMVSSARNLSAELGTSFLTTAVAIQVATKAQIDFKTALRAANKASASGISAENVTKFAEAAAKSAQTFGGTTTDALNRMVTAILQGETELLKEVGIVISSNEAFLQYGITIGKAANQLTSFEKRQALSNAVLKESERLFAGTTIQVNNFEVLGAVLQDNAQKILKFVNNSLGVSNVIGNIADSIPLMATGVALFSRTVLRTLTPSLGEVIKKSKSTAEEAESLSSKAAKKSVEIRKAGGQTQVKVEIQKNEAILAAIKEANKKELIELKKSGQLKAAAFRKGSTLQKLAAGESITQKGVNSLANRNVSLKSRKKTASDPGLKDKVSKSIVQGANAQISAENALNASLKRGAAGEKILALRIKVTTEARKAAIAATKANIATSKAFALTTTQESGALGTFSSIIRITKERLKQLAVDAKVAGTSVSLFQKSVAVATVTTTLLGQAVSKAFSFLVSAALIVGTVALALDLLGIELFKQTKAEKNIEEATTKMSEAFEESSTTLDSMIDSFDRFKQLAPDQLFQKTSIATGNFIQEIGGNFSTAITNASKSLREMAAADETLRQAELRKETAVIKATKALQSEVDMQKKLIISASKRNRGAEFAASQVQARIRRTVSQNKDVIKAEKEIEKAEKRVSNSRIDSTTVTDLLNASLSELKIITDEFENSGIQFPLLEKLKQTDGITKVLTGNLDRFKTSRGLITAFAEAIGKTGIEGLALIKAFVPLANSFKTTGVTATGAGKSVEELLASLVLFRGTATRLNKTVFKDETIANFAKSIEQAEKTIKTLDLAGASATKGMATLASAMGVSTEEARNFVKESAKALEQAGNLTQNRLSKNFVSKEAQKELALVRATLDTEKELVKNILKKEELGVSILSNELKNAKAEKKARVLTLLAAKTAKSRLISIKAETDELLKQKTLLNIIKDGTLAPGGIKDINIQLKQLELRKQAAILDAQSQKEGERQLANINATIARLEVARDVAKEFKGTSAEIADELGRVRQNLRGQSNLELQILTTSKALAKTTGDAVASNNLLIGIELKRLKNKRQDLEFDKETLKIRRERNVINKEKFDREIIILKLREKQLELQAKNERINRNFNIGANLAQTAAPTADGAGAVLSSAELFAITLVEGAKRFNEALLNNNPLQDLIVGLFDAFEDGVDALVNTIGTGANVFKSIITAVDTTLRKVILETASKSIKQGLLSLIPGLKDTRKALIDGAITRTATSNDAILVVLSQMLTKQEISSASGGGGGGLLGKLFGIALGSSGNDILDVGRQGGNIPSPVFIDPADFSGGTRIAADGGLFSKPTFSVIGEGRNSEAVVPLPNNREIPVKLQGGSTGDTVVNNFDFTNADPQTENRIRGLIAQSKEDAFNNVFSAINQGGRFSKIAGRRR